MIAFIRHTLKFPYLHSARISDLSGWCIYGSCTSTKRIQVISFPDECARAGFGSTHRKWCALRSDAILSTPFLFHNGIDSSSERCCGDQSPSVIGR
jgi:hypothetical protein